MTADTKAATSDAPAATARARQPERWPLAVALALLLMIGVCGAFFAVATAYPDPPVDLRSAGLRPYQGYVAGADPAGVEP